MITNKSSYFINSDTNISHESHYEIIYLFSNMKLQEYSQKKRPKKAKP